MKSVQAFSACYTHSTIPRFVNLTRLSGCTADLDLQYSHSYITKFLASIHRLTHFSLNKLSLYYIYILKVLNFNLRNVRLCDLDILTEKWINYL